jgi:flagellar biosynthesis chaperone FliJ
VIDVEKKKPDAPTERFSKSFQEYLNTRLTLDEIMKKKKEFNNKNDNPEPVCNP